MGFTILKNSRLAVHVLVCVFAISSWIDINGLWVELPLMVTVLPEAWALPSYMSIIIQVANIGPLVFGVLTYVWKEKRLETKTSILIITVGFIACILLAFFWQETTYVGGDLHSTALLTLNFLLAFVDCTSSMAFLAFMSSLKPQYMPSYFVGESLSGLLPSLTALAQGAGEITCVNGSNVNATEINGTWYNETTYNVYPMYTEPRFSVQVFFFILAAMMLCSFVAFCILRFSSFCKSEFVNHFDNSIIKDQKSNKSPPKYYVNGDDHDPTVLEIEEQVSFSKIKMATLLFLVAWINFFTSSFLLSLQTYSVLPYGLEYYHLTVTLTNIFHPVASFTAMFLALYSILGITFITFMGSLCSAYIIVCAATSPIPPLSGTPAGGPVTVTVWVLCIYLLTYAKVCVANVLRQGGRLPLILCGAFTQIGSFTGAIVGYILINVYHLFTDAPYC